ncbi:MAG: rsbP6 [Ilumatobacteraceae bacterium]|nr:rsbP6 [Ilumatobacteraceae bacterium]
MCAEARRAPDLTFRFGHTLQAARRARMELEPMFADHFDGFGFVVELAASELVSNVVVHTEDGGTLRAWLRTDDGPFRIEVEDTDSHLPVVRPACEGVGGRGLQIIADIAEQWGMFPVVGGKVVWAEFARDETA